MGHGLLGNLSVSIGCLPECLKSFSILKQIDPLPVRNSIPPLAVNQSTIICKQDGVISRKYRAEFVRVGKE